MWVTYDARERHSILKVKKKEILLLFMKQSVAYLCSYPVYYYYYS